MDIDYDDIECDNCHHTGVVPNGGFDYECLECGHEGSLLEDEDPDDNEGDEVEEEEE